MTSEFSPKVWIVIVNYKSAKDCMDCIVSLLNSDYQNFGVAVVDNHSPDNSVSVLTSFFQSSLPDSCVLESKALNSDSFKLNRFLLIKHDQNRGFAAGNNVALIWLSKLETWIWLLNPDIVVAVNTLSELLEDAGADPHQILGTKVFSSLNRDELLHIGAWKINWFTGTVSPVKSESHPFDYIYGGSLFTYSLNFKNYGLLPEHYFLYWEETDWCFRLKKMGILMRISKNAIVYDRVGGSVGRGYLAFYYYTLNALRFISSYKPWMIKFVLTMIFFRFVKKILTIKIEQAKGIFNATIFYFK